MENHYEDDDQDVNPKLPAANENSVTRIRIYSLNEEILENWMNFTCKKNSWRDKDIYFQLFHSPLFPMYSDFFDFCLQQLGFTWYDHIIDETHSEVVLIDHETTGTCIKLYVNHIGLFNEDALLHFK